MHSHVTEGTDRLVHILYSLSEHEEQQMDSTLTRFVAWHICNAYLLTDCRAIPHHSVVV